MHLVLSPRGRELERGLHQAKVGHSIIYIILQAMAFALLLYKTNHVGMTFV